MERSFSYKAIKERQVQSAIELENLGLLSLRLQAYLAFREVYPQKGRSMFDKTELEGVEELLIYDSRVIFVPGDSVYSFNSWNQQEIPNTEAIRRWANENPEHARHVKSSTITAEFQARSMWHTLKVDPASRRLIQRVIDSASDIAV